MNYWIDKFEQIVNFYYEFECVLDPDTTLVQSISKQSE